MIDSSLYERHFHSHWHASRWSLPFAPPAGITFLPAARSRDGEFSVGVVLGVKSNVCVNGNDDLEFVDAGIQRFTAPIVPIAAPGLVILSGKVARRLLPAVYAASVS
jgi:hypothetical protein